MRNAMIVLCLTAIAAAASVSADAAECGPLSKWTGQVCIGPHGKAYCPLDMTMQGQTCVANATAQSQVARPPGPTNAPVAGMKIFHSGTAVESMRVPLGAPPAGRMELGAGIQPYVNMWNLTQAQGKFTLTPFQPMIPGSGSLGFVDCSFYSWEGNFIVMNMPSQSGIAVLLQTAVAGTTYVIDETVAQNLTGANTPNCQATIQGPDGTTETSTCGSGSYQHVVFAYQATETGSAMFYLTTNSPISWFGATVARLQ
jgi:hypothetical protein